jgi:hypothetical protein
LPSGRRRPFTPAADHPIEAYTVADNQDPLPRVLMGGEPDAQLLPRYRLRVRTLTVPVPPRLLVPRNGVGSAQVVLTDLSGLRDVRASVGDLRGPGGRALPAGGVRLRFGAQGEELHGCDRLDDRPPQGAKTVPVWLEVTAPRDQPPGWYAGTLSLQANGKRFQVPAQVFVSGSTVPDPRDFRSTVVVMHSPEATARTYDVRPYGDERFALMGQSLAVAGQLGGGIGSDTRPTMKTGEVFRQWAPYARQLEASLESKDEYLTATVQRVGPGTKAGPMIYRAPPMVDGRWTRLIAQRLGGLPAEQQRPYRELLDDLGRRTNPWVGAVAMLPQTELSYD